MSTVQNPTNHVGMGSLSARLHLCLLPLLNPEAEAESEAVRAARWLSWRSSDRLRGGSLEESESQGQKVEGGCPGLGEGS